MAKLPQRRSSTGEIDKFLTRSNSLTRREDACGRLIFAIDATASRQATWNRARQIQGEMFMATQNLGGLEIQLCYYRGFNDFQAGAWLRDEISLLQQMNTVHCEGGYTQILRVLKHGLKEHSKQAVKALVLICDACEEKHDLLAGKAGELGIAGLPLFMFQEGHDRPAETLFRQMAKLSGGAWARFDHSSPTELADLLGAVARYAAAGRESMLEYSAGASSGVKLLLDQLK